ncbi:TBC1 domain family member 22A-like protein [Cricetulus griseus]|nr:TBC1 domain family member 22A-like protein [Cricetulus griseus]
MALSVPHSEWLPCKQLTLLQIHLFALHTHRPAQVDLWDTELLLFLQNLPTARWNDQDVSLLLAEAYRLKFAFADAPNHYKK